MYYYNYRENLIDNYLFPFRQLDLGNVWHEKNGDWHGVWQRRGNSNIFDAKWTMSGTTESVTAVLEMFLTGNNVHIIRRYSSDGNDCYMTGTIAQGGRAVSGTSRCNRGGGNWNATIYY
jgi:hypothetical protein